MTFADKIKAFLHNFGWHLGRYPTLSIGTCVRQRMMNYLQIDLVLDAGANIGQYGSEIRQEGYTGRIESFEPVAGYHEILRQTAQKKQPWNSRALALGDNDGKSEINVAGTMSSLLNASSDASNAVKINVLKKETIEVARLDSIYDQVAAGAKSVWLKIDVQGFEPQVLAGALQSLTKLTAVEMEMSLWPFYSGQTCYREMVSKMEQFGFQLWSLNPATRQLESGRLIEMDGIFVRANLGHDGILRA